jgi:hypothetical protein
MHSSGDVPPSPRRRSCNGTANSPAIAGPIGAAILRLLLARSPAKFSGQGSPNIWWTGFRFLGYDPNLGYGFLWRSLQDGLPAVLLWVHVDDFLLHRPTYNKAAAPLSALMDTALDTVLAHPAKMSPPSQRVRYCGFIYDTAAIPTLEIHQERPDRTLVMLDFMLGHRSAIEFRGHLRCPPVPRRCNPGEAAPNISPAAI